MFRNVVNDNLTYKKYLQSLRRTTYLDAEFWPAGYMLNASGLIIKVSPLLLSVILHQTMSLIDFKHRLMKTNKLTCKRHTP